MIPLLDDPSLWVANWPPLALPFLVMASAFLEYVFPPYPGDGLMLLGFFLAGQGAVPVELIFVAAFVGSGLGAATAFQLGRRYGSALVDRLSQRLLRRHRRFARLKPLIERGGEKILALNRFFPVVRGVMLYGAGAGPFRFLPSVLWAALSNFVFLCLLATIGLRASASWHEIQDIFGSLSRWIGVGLLGLAALCLFWIWRFSQSDVEDALEPLSK